MTFYIYIFYVYNGWIYIPIYKNIYRNIVIYYFWEKKGGKLYNKFELNGQCIAWGGQEYFDI